MTAQMNIEFALPILITSAQHQELQAAMWDAGRRASHVNHMVNWTPKWKRRPSQRQQARSLLLACEML
jgi:hypothetical protein